MIDGELDELLAALPAVALDGPRGVGKTVTAERRAASTVRLDDPAQRAIAEADPMALLDRPRPLLLDEWQHVPSLWDAVRRAVDRDDTAGQYLFTGSASPAQRPTHSGAARIVTVRMRPLTLAERGIASPTVSLRALLTGERPSLVGTTDVALGDYTREIVASGFPGLRHLSGRALRAQLDGYLERVVDRDFEEQGHRVRQPQTLRRWLAAYAAATSTTASLETIRDSATGDAREKPAKTSVILYREVLERLRIVDPVPSWWASRNHLTALAQAPKHQLTDPALAARLLGLDEGALLTGAPTGGAAAVSERLADSARAPRDGTLLGRLFEALVTLDVRVYAQAAEATTRHLRTHSGRQEIDLIVVRGDQRVVALEVKLGAVVTDDDVKHLHWLRAQIGDDLLDAAVITTGPQAYRRRDGIGVVPAALLGA